jgi:hypothetical protein
MYLYLIKGIEEEKSLLELITLGERLEYQV